VKALFGPDGFAAHAPRLRIYVSREGHFSIRKAAAMLGIGEANVRAINTDSRLRMDLAHLDQYVREDRRDGHLPMCVVATAGTTGTGAIDPLPELAEFARAHDLWLHIDAAYGGFAALAPSVRPLLAGIELADSLALDPHKWLYTSTGCGCILYRDPTAAHRAFAGGDEYTRTLGLADAESFAFWDYGPELSRPFRALGVWLLMKFAGAAELGRAIERNIACAQHLEKLVAASSDFEMLAPVSLSVFCFRYAPPGFTGSLDDLNERLLVRLQRDGSSYLSNARVAGRFALRGCVVNYRTTERDMEILLEDVRRAAART
jgi:aromatic-L-amino-acid/L-tryptophan decarboxylase